MAAPCKEPDCERFSTRAGYCNMHYVRRRRAGLIEPRTTSGSSKGGSEATPCPLCSNTKSRTVDSRIMADGAHQRRRECCACGHRFRTREFLVDERGQLYEEPKAPPPPPTLNSIVREFCTGLLSILPAEHE